MEEKLTPQDAEGASECSNLSTEIVSISQLGAPPVPMQRRRCMLKEQDPRARITINAAAAKAWKSSVDTTDCTWGKDQKKCPFFQ